MAPATARSTAGSQVAARAMATGNAVEAPSATPRGPSVNRMPGSRAGPPGRPGTESCCTARTFPAGPAGPSGHRRAATATPDRSTGRPGPRPPCPGCVRRCAAATAAANAVSGGQIRSVSDISGPALRRRSGGACPAGRDEGPHAEGEVDQRDDGGGGLGVTAPGVRPCRRTPRAASPAREQCPAGPAGRPEVRHATCMRRFSLLPSRPRINRTAPMAAGIRTVLWTAPVRKSRPGRSRCERTRRRR